jgi:hypothetical protein
MTTTDSETRKPRRLRRFITGSFRWAGVLITILAALALMVWIAGRMISDRYEWSQWIAWTPTPVAIGLAALGFIGVMHPGGSKRRLRTRVGAWGIAFAGFIIYFSLFEHHLLTPGCCSSQSAGFRIMHWNPSLSENDNAGALSQTVVDLNADITILTNAPAAPWEKPVRRWLGPQRLPVVVFPFSVITKLPILEIRRVVAARQMHATLMRFDATQPLGRELTILAVDLPSDPERSRMDTAKQLRTWLDEANLPPIDIMLGDFNMTRDSASLHTIAPGYRDAFDEAGAGYGATYPRKTPWLHIDHMLIAGDIKPLSYCILDPGAGTHRLQMMTIKAEN